ncbi:hypothetical protein DBR40_25585 [Pedobacter sp. KBW01]|uniref:hypothetical protein n=1 Tax=Pedobacter sp. KBW01 TaxID=2153364 RepID=UPI000F5A681B|nr:hypothetical protein [Pedobacter sp. KBW01]RQO64400.1 hypothetical protein DBR40_25585 [Pedobacter sp. KBW01]
MFKANFKFFLPFILVFLVSAFFCSTYSRQGHNWGDDFALYLAQAKSLATGSTKEVIDANKFSINYSSIHNFSPLLAPWGWPILLAPVYQIFGLNIVAFKVFEYFFWLAFLSIFYLFSSLNIKKELSLLLLLFLCIHPNYNNHLNTILTEIPYLFFSTFSLYCIQKYQPSTFTYLKGILLGLVIYFSFLIRTEGIILIAALFASQVRWYVLHRKELKFKILISWLSTPFLSIITLYCIGLCWLPNGFLTHLHNSNLISIHSINNAFHFYIEKSQLFLGTENYVFVFYLLSILFFWGFIYRFIKDIHASIYLLCITIVYLLWPFKESRYLLVFFPFICYFICQGIALCYQLYSLKPYLYTGITIAMLSCILFFGDTNLIENRKRPPIEGPFKPNAQEMFAYIKKYTKPNDVIIFFRPRAMSLFTERKSAMIFRNWEEIQQLGNYLVIHKHSTTPFQFAPTAPFFFKPDFSKKFTIVFDNWDFTVYKILALKS